MQQVHVHLERPTPRARYAVEQLLGRMLGWHVELVSAEALTSVKGPKLVYGKQEIQGAFRVIPSGFLEREGWVDAEPVVLRSEELPMLFPVADGDLPFDPFAAAFYLLTRYEEWSDLDTDEHGRPLTEQLHCARHGYLHRPAVDEWALHLAERWRAMDANVPEPDRSYRQVVTVDLDNGFKYLGRPIWRTLGSMVRDVMRGKWGEVVHRMRVLSGLEKDPFDVFDELRTVFQDHAERCLFFILAAERGPHDHAVPLSYPPYAERVGNLASWAEVGSHPSYESSVRTSLIPLERSVLAEVTGVPVLCSRQHFLRFRIPDTYRELDRLGFKEEHSMGFHDRPGFRAGTCTPFPWFDLGTDRVTELTIHPFAVMDNTLRHKLGLTPDQAVDEMSGMIAELKRLNGTFTGLWHESFLGNDPDNSGWRDAILRIIADARP